MKILIVGGGLAGLSIAHHLECNNISFQIIDAGKNYSTKVAAGIINPMSFRRMIKSWKVDELLPIATSFYSYLEKKLGVSFFHPQVLRRVFSTAYERKLWEERQVDKNYISYVGKIDDSTNDYIKHQFGTGLVKSVFAINTSLFLSKNQEYFKNQERLIYSEFDFSRFDPKQCSYKNEVFSHIIFAEGFQGEDNPYFNFLPFKNAKGEILTLSVTKLNQNEILNRKCFMLPLGNHKFKLGSTYAWNTKNLLPSMQAKKELLEKFEQLCNLDYSYVSHESGIRPVAADRRPMIGEHPKYKGIFIFNGLGAKGFMIAPFYSQQFVHFLQGNKKLDTEVDINRFVKKN